MGHRTRTGVALFDAGVMTLAAYEISGGSFAQPTLDIVLWGSAIAASLVAVVIASGASAFIAWIGIGYVLHAALLATAEPSVVLLALAVALMPVVPRPRRSLSLGIICATLAAFAFALVLGRIAG